MSAILDKVMQIESEPNRLDLFDGDTIIEFVQEAHTNGIDGNLNECVFTGINRNSGLWQAIIMLGLAQSENQKDWHLSELGRELAEETYDQWISWEDWEKDD